jgi:hypothetical protein
MSDLHTRLDDIAGPAVTPSAATVEADLARGRRALKRRRAGQFITGSGFVAAAVLAAALVVPAFSTAEFTPAPGNSVSTGAATKLVAYTGEQPAGFTLDQVPEGWEVQGVDKYGLTLAPLNAPDQDPKSCVGKICIDQQGSVPDVKKQNVRVGDKPAVLATMLGDADGVPGTLFIKQSSGVYLVIQSWDGLGWSTDDFIRFAAGVTVNKGAGLTVG